MWQLLFIEHSQVTKRVGAWAFECIAHAGRQEVPVDMDELVFQ